MYNKITIDKSSIKPITKINQTQIILQRHCDYDRKTGELTKNSIENQYNLCENFMQDLVNISSTEELKNTYFLFVSSPTISYTGNFQRCVITTNIPFNMTKDIFTKFGIQTNHIMNLNNDSNYKNNIHMANDLEEPRMFNDNTGYLEFLKQQNDGINLDFWLDFEEDKYKEKRQEFGAEGPDEIVNRGIHFIKVLQRYSQYFHKKHENSRLIIWCGTHYDLLSPLAKQTILNYNKEDAVFVDYCGGISLLIDENNTISANLNGENFPIYFQDNVQHHRHF